MLDVHNEMRKEHRPDQHHLFFYYKAGESLKNGQG
jgi:hypothetical protein